MIHRRIHRSLPSAVVAIAFLLTDCGGGGQSTGALPTSGFATNTTANTPAGEATASVKIDIPAKHASATTRKTAYVSPSIQSIVLNAVGGGQTTANLTSGSAGCAAQAPVITQYAVPATNDTAVVSNIVPGPDGNMYFISSYALNNGNSVFTGGYLWKISPAGAISQVTSTGGTEPGGLTVGNDGRLWTVADYYPSPANPAGMISAFTTGGIRSDYAPQTELPQLIGVTTVGNLVYFPENPSAGRKTGTVDTSGNVTELSNTTMYDFKPQSTGPDGLPWGTASANTGSVLLAKLSGSNPVTYDVGFQPTNVAPAPDGNMWFTAAETDGSTITPVVGKISTSGTGVATYRIPSSGIPGPLTGGPDGNVWFVESSATVGRVTPAGAIDEFNVTNYPRYIAAGPDGNLWFTEYAGANANFVGKLTPPGTECTVTLNVPIAAPTGSASTVIAKAYDGLNGTGNVLGYASMPFTATAAGPNVINFTLNGVVASVKITAPTTAALVIGQPNQIPLSVTAFDAQSNTIIAPGAYSDAAGNPLTITVTDTDPSSATAIQRATVSVPGLATSPTLTYTGAGAATATISATISGGTITGAVTGTTLTAH